MVKGKFEGIMWLALGCLALRALIKCHRNWVYKQLLDLLQTENKNYIWCHYLDYLNNEINPKCILPPKFSWSLLLPQFSTSFSHLSPKCIIKSIHNLIRIYKYQIFHLRITWGISQIIYTFKSWDIVLIFPF